ncbi:Dcr2p [Sugiyamaella lignohabitans]|uniref:Dcr2p n=1 Tax=Sugiyamaella lignohabitans TaxID=796027 RepID=A0A161HIU6_9ASCO|nr:Dcr2p [Sugiyamaella lignohabitans]ANB11168.1 Dcr2p [Sugiyamaella lignohabitans]
MALLPRFWVRQLLKLGISIFVLSLLIVFVDFYFNFLPTSFQTRLPLHQSTAVIVDLKVQSCLTVSGCAEPNGWYKIPKNLYLNTKWVRKGFVYVKRVEETELQDDHKVVLDLALAHSTEANGHGIPLYIVKDILGQATSEKEETEASRDAIRAIDDDEAAKHGWTLRDEDSGLWVKQGKYHRSESVTGVDVLFGKDSVDPRPNWSLKPGFLFRDSGKEAFASLTIRRGVENKPSKPVLRVNPSGKFKILQVADLHFSTGEGICRDTFPSDSAGNCLADPRTLDFIKLVLDQETPDFVVMTGDQIFGDTAPDAESALLKAVAPFIEREIPYAMVFGNHDAQGSLSKEDLMSIIATLPFSLSEAGPEDVDGIGNYVLQALSPKNDHPAISFYFLDSHSHVALPKGGSTYDHIKSNQLKFIENTSTKIKELQKDYTHIPLSMAFFHIPIPEYRKTNVNPVVGSHREPVMGPTNDEGTRDVLAKVGVSVVSVGHDHVNDYCMFDKPDREGETGIWLCYGGAVGEGGYAGYGGYVRRLRLFEIDTQSASIKSWKLTREQPELKLDEQTLVSNGHVSNE